MPSLFDGLYELHRLILVLDGSKSGLKSAHRVKMERKYRRYCCVMGYILLSESDSDFSMAMCTSFVLNFCSYLSTCFTDR